MRIVAALALAVGLIVPAHATPPRVVYVQEQIAGQTKDAVFVFRRVTDNLGLHHQLWTDVELIARDVQTGAETGKWPVHSVLDSSAWFADYGESERTKDVTPDGRIDPFTVLAKRGAWEIMPGVRSWLVDRAKLSGDAIEISDDGQTVTHRLTMADAIKRITADVSAIESALEERPTMGGGGVVALPPIDASHCTIGDVHTFSLSIEPNRMGYAARLDCRDEDDLTSVQQYLVIPAAN